MGGGEHWGIGGFCEKTPVAAGLSLPGTVSYALGGGPPRRSLVLGALQCLQGHSALQGGARCDKFMTSSLRKGLAAATLKTLS